MAFFREQLHQTKRNTLEEAHRLECDACPLRDCGDPSQNMPPSGNASADVYILAEAPGKKESALGEPLVGPAGQIMRDALAEVYTKHHRIQKTRDGEETYNLTSSVFRFNNVVRTRPPANRNPTFQEIEACRPSVVRDIHAVQPKVIIGTGNIPLNWAISQSAITTWRGRAIPVDIEGHHVWYVATFHPSLIDRERKKQRGHAEEERAFKRDIALALDIAENWGPPSVEEFSYPTISYFTGDEGVDALADALDALPDTVSLDIETNCKWPFQKNAKLLSVSIGTGDNVVCFAVGHHQAEWSHEERDAVIDLLGDFIMSGRRIVVHNLQFEVQWLSYSLGYEVCDPEIWDDTLVQAFILDPRKGAHSLDALTITHYGFSLKNVSAVSVKNLDNEALKAVLDYNSLDVRYTHKIYQEQEARLAEDGLQLVYREQVRRIPTLALTQQIGLPVDSEENQRHASYLVDYIATIKDVISQLPVVQEFEEQKGYVFNPSSTQQCAYIFEELLDRDEGKRQGRQFCTDKEVLAQIDHPLAEKLLELRRHERLYNNYVRDIGPGGKYLYPDGRLHCEFNACSTITRRLSSQAINAQNVPKRNDAWIRSQVVAPPGYQMVAIDYGQLEARVVAMASEDESFIQAIRDRMDIHAVWAEHIARVYPKRVGGESFVEDSTALKNLRTDVKNQFTFPLFYGAQSQAIANYLNIPFSVAERLVTEFWDKFPRVKEWQEGLFEFYQRNFYLETLNGYRIHGPLKYNNIINYPIQSVSADLVMDGMCRLSELARKTGDFVYQPVINIHDDLTFFVPDNSLDDYLETIIGYMLTPDYTWVTAPIAVEVEIGGDWYNMEEIGTFVSDTFFLE